MLYDMPNHFAFGWSQQNYMDIIRAIRVATPNVYDQIMLNNTLYKLANDDKKVAIVPIHIVIPYKHTGFEVGAL